MKIGIFGGCFDPIHVGHIQPAREVMARFGLDRVVFVPTAVPPHKPGRQFAQAHARFSMVELALLDHEDLWVSDIELTPERPAYTIDTLERFRDENPGADLYFILGGDAFSQLDSWHRWTELTQVARLVVLVRPGWCLDSEHSCLSKELANFAQSDRVVFFANEPVQVSSTTIRSQIAGGEMPPADQVPELVLKYIRKYSLYR